MKALCKHEKNLQVLLNYTMQQVINGEWWSKYHAGSETPFTMSFCFQIGTWSKILPQHQYIRHIPTCTVHTSHNNVCIVNHTVDFYVLLTVHPGTTLGKWPTWCTITLYNTFIIIILCGPGSSVGIATVYGLDGPVSNPGGNEIFRPPRRALGLTQPPAKWVPGLSRG